VKRLLPKVLAIIFALGVALFLYKWSGIRNTESIEYGIAKTAFDSSEPRIYTPDGTPQKKVDSSEVSVLFSSVFCPTADTMGFRILVGLSMYVGDSSVYKEIKEKEEGVVRLIQFTFSKLLPTQIESERLKELLMDRINGYLLKGRVKSIKFTQFDIVPLETP